MLYKSTKGHNNTHGQVNHIWVISIFNDESQCPPVYWETV